MKRELYAKNWDCIALIIKWMAGWKCQECGRPCRRPGETFDELFRRLESKDSKFLDETSDFITDKKGAGASIEKPRRFVLTVAHLDQNPGNNDRANLKALCSVCHLRHDAPFNGKKAARTRFENQHKNQLKLF